MEFISEQEAHKIDQFRRKSRFVSEFRSRLTRIPLKMRSMSTEREGSFVMIASTKDAQYRKPNSSVIRKKRTVTEWARGKNFSFKASSEPLTPNFNISAVLQNDQTGTQTPIKAGSESHQPSFDSLKLVPRFASTMPRRSLSGGNASYQQLKLNKSACD